MLLLYLMAGVYCFTLRYTSAACQLVGCETTLNSSAGLQRHSNTIYDEVGVSEEATSVIENTIRLIVT